MSRRVVRGYEGGSLKGDRGDMRIFGWQFNAGREGSEDIHVAIKGGDMR